ncbi:phosphoribosylanthranilate isomerase [Gemmiger sp.]
MTKIKFCGMMRAEDIAAANALHPDYIGFVFAPGSRRTVTPEQAAVLKAQLAPEIRAVGVFMNAPPAQIAALLAAGTIDIVQLHGQEDEAYLQDLRVLTDKPVIKAFRVDTAVDLERAAAFPADGLLLDSGAGGTGTAFDWTLLRDFKRPYFLAGGLCAENVGKAIQKYHPYAVDVSSGIETDGKKDAKKMAAFAAAVRKEA